MPIFVQIFIKDPTNFDYESNLYFYLGIFIWNSADMTAKETVRDRHTETRRNDVGIVLLQQAIQHLSNKRC
jgi:hypothetical protein